MAQVRVGDPEKQVLRDSDRDMSRAEGTERQSRLPPCPQSSWAPALARAKGRGALLSLCCPLVATTGKAVAEPGALGTPGSVGAEGRAALHLALLEEPPEALALLSLHTNAPGLLGLWA